MIVMVMILVVMIVVVKGYDCLSIEQRLLRSNEWPLTVSSLPHLEIIKDTIGVALQLKLVKPDDGDVVALI